MSKFSLKDLMPTVVQQSENDKPSLIELSLDDIVPNVSNEYGIRDIDELAASIEQVGLLQPIRVKKDNESGKYIIISGERRYTAFCKLAESYDKYRMIPCIVASKKDRYTDELELLIANIQTRELTDYERVYQAQRAKELIESMRRAGADIKGRTRENIALILNTSQTQVARYESIYKKLHPSLMELFKRDEIGVSAAYELSRLPEDEQKEIYSNSALNEINISAVKILSNDNVLSDSSNNDENGVVTLSNSEDMLSEHLPLAAKTQEANIKIYQINSERDKDYLRFMEYSRVYNADSIVDRSIYDEVFSGSLDCESLEDIYEIFNCSKEPKEYKGRSMSVSDVVEVKNSVIIENGFYYCDSIGFKKIRFEFIKTEPAKITEKKSTEEDKRLFVNDCENIYKDICDILKRNLKDDTEHLHLMRLMWEAFSEWS